MAKLYADWVPFRIASGKKFYLGDACRRMEAHTRWVWRPPKAADGESVEREK